MLLHTHTHTRKKKQHNMENAPHKTLFLTPANTDLNIKHEIQALYTQIMCSSTFNIYTHTYSFATSWNSACSMPISGHLDFISYIPVLVNYSLS